MPKSKIIFYPSPETPLTREEIQHIFAQFSAADQVMVALRQILAERLASATADNIESRLTERAAGMVAGRMQEIATLQNELNTLLQNGAQLRHQRAVDKPRVK